MIRRICYMLLELTLLTVSFLQQSPSFKIPLDNLDSPPPLPSTPPPNLLLPPKQKNFKNTNDNNNSDVPPPLPKRNRPDVQNNKIDHLDGEVPLNINALLLNEDVNHANLNKRTTKSINDSRDRCYSLGRKPRNSVMVDNSLYSDFNIVPPPLPPRAPVSNIGSSESDAANSISKQMSYPLVATCATLVNNYVSNNCSICIISVVYFLFILFVAM